MHTKHILKDYLPLTIFSCLNFQTCTKDMKSPFSYLQIFLVFCIYNNEPKYLLKRIQNTMSESSPHKYTGKIRAFINDIKYLQRVFYQASNAKAGSDSGAGGPSARPRGQRTRSQSKKPPGHRTGIPYPNRSPFNGSRLYNHFQTKTNLISDQYNVQSFLYSVADARKL